MSVNEGQRIGRYVLGSELGRGGMGVIWRAVDTSSGEAVAIKVVADRLIHVGDFAARFADEVRRHSGLRHPNIVAIRESFSWQGDFCMVMELIDGISLETLLESRPNHRLDPAEACSLIKGVLAPLDYAHQQRIVHRDVKPSNVLLDRDNRPHLTDFGIALAVGEKRRTRAGQAIGTAQYMSPEQIRLPDKIDHRTDVYSVGCMFYEMLTGRPPFVVDPNATGDSDFIVKGLQVSQEPMPPHVREPSIPVALSDLVMRALRKDRDERFAGCGQFMRAIDALPATASAPVAPAAWLRAALVVVGVLMLLVVIALVVT